MKKITSFLIVLAMLAAMMVIMIPAASAAWDGTSMSAALVGTGSELDPYLVQSENDLAFVANQVNTSATTYADMYIKLTADLDLGGKKWTPIGENKSTGFFSGIFDGDGHTIYGLNVYTNPDDKNALYGGVFGRVDNGTVMNLTVEGATVVSSKYAGAIVGNLTAKAGGSPSAIINCHAINCSIYGLQIGGIVGRSSQEKVDKGFLKITGCTANTITLDKVTATEFPNITIDNTNHFIGGIVGCIGATVVSGCTAMNITANAYGTGFAPVGGIAGVVGADKVNADIVNCAVIGVNFTASADCHAEKTSIGGLAGKLAHVGVASGDPNMEVNVFNCFVSDVSITNNTTSANNGVVAGLINDTIFSNDVYYVPVEGLNAFGTYNFYPDPIFTSVSHLGELSVENLNKGNSTAVWVANPVAGYPTVDIDAAIANQPTFVDYYVEHPEGEETDPPADETTKAPEDETTKAPAEETTKAPADETTEAPEDETTEAPATNAPTTNAPVTTDKAEEKKGCGGFAASGVIVIALLGTAIVIKKKN